MSTNGFSLGRGSERFLLAPVDLPDIPGSVILFRPETGWLYTPDAVDELDVRLAVERARDLEWNV